MSAVENSGAAATQAPTIDYDKLADAVAGKLGGRLDKIESAQTDLTKRLDTFGEAASKADKASGEQPKYLTADDLNKALDTRDSRQQATAQRDAFIAANLAKLPKMYQKALGTDPTKWVDEAKTIQAEFEADLKAQGGTAENKGSAQRDGGAAANQQPADFSKRDGFDLLTEAMAKDTPAKVEPNAKDGN